MLYHGTANGSESRRQLEAVLPRPSGGDFAAGLTIAARSLLASQSQLAANNVTLQAIIISIFAPIVFIWSSINGLARQSER